MNSPQIVAGDGSLTSYQEYRSSGSYLLQLLSEIVNFCKIFVKLIEAFWKHIQLGLIVLKTCIILECKTAEKIRLSKRFDTWFFWRWSNSHVQFMGMSIFEIKYLIVEWSFLRNSVSVPQPISWFISGIWRTTINQWNSWWLVLLIVNFLVSGKVTHT